MGPYRSLCVLMGAHKSLCVLIDSNGSLMVVIFLFAYLWILMCPNGSL